MAKGSRDDGSKGLSLGEAQAFVRQADEAVFGPGSGAFVSKYTFAGSDLSARLRAIEWFVHCGEPREFDLTMPIERVNTWPKSIKGMKSLNWENVTLEARNQLTSCLSKHHRDHYLE